MWNGINCDRCGLYSAGQSSICKEKYYHRETKRIEYELNESYILNKVEEIYSIVSGYGSKFDMSKIYIIERFKNESELKKRFLWISNIGEDYNNICDNCIEEMLFYKEIRAEDHIHFIQPFYTACCDKYIERDKNMNKYYKVEKINRFPYFSYYSFSTWEDEYRYGGFESEQITYFLIREEDIFFNYHPYCTVCKDCFDQHYIRMKPFFLKEHPVLYTIQQLRGNMEIYLDFELRDGKSVITRHSCNNPNIKKDFIEKFYMYQSKKNMLNLKKELSLYILKRNLEIIRKCVFISKDICQLIYNTVS